MLSPTAVRYFTQLTLSLCILLTIQGLAIYQRGGKSAKSESNFFSSIARIQIGAKGRPDIMLLGSSLTGRLPDRSNGFTGVANLGCDGGSAADILHAIDTGQLPDAPTLIIEGNTLYRAKDRQASEIFKAIHTPWFRAGMHLPQLGAAARPSAFAYSMMLARKIGDAQGPEGPLLPMAGGFATEYPQTTMPAEVISLIQELSELISRLQSRNIRLLLVVLPPGADEDSLNIRIPRELSRVSGVPLLDLTEKLPADAVRYTDGVHMDSASAAAALRTILAEMEKNP